MKGNKDGDRGNELALRIFISLYDDAVRDLVGQRLEMVSLIVHCARGSSQKDVTGRDASLPLRSAVITTSMQNVFNTKKAAFGLIQ
jgi:hypothetical protein